MRISVTRSVDFVIVENRDYETSDDDTLALNDVIDAHLRGQDLIYDQALHVRRRQRLRFVPIDDDDGRASRR